MKVKRGSGRIVLFVGPYVFKFPSFHNFCGGVRQNLTEHKCWKECRAPFLVPTIAGLGFVNIQKLAVGEEPTWDEMDALAIEMGKRTNGQVYMIDPHCLQPENFLRNNSRYRIVDYGDGRIKKGGLLFTNYLVRWHNELTDLFSHKETPPVI